MRQDMQPSAPPSPPRNALVWAVLGVIVALLSYLAWRGYLNTELLLNFANMFYC